MRKFGILQIESLNDCYRDLMFLFSLFRHVASCIWELGSIQFPFGYNANFLLPFQGEVELHEFIAVYVPNCCSGFIACYTYNGARRFGGHCITWNET